MGTNAESPFRATNVSLPGDSGPPARPGIVASPSTVSTLKHLIGQAPPAPQIVPRRRCSGSWLSLLCRVARNPSEPSQSPDPIRGSGYGAQARVLAIVPAYNERDSIGEVVQDLLRHAPEVDVVVVDDGSTDGTASVVPRHARVQVLSLPFNLGIGAAMQTGYRYAQLGDYDAAVQVDGDGQHPADQVAALLEELRHGADLVIGSRFLEGASYDQTLSRAVGSRLLRLTLRLLCGRTFTDCTSGFRAANRRVVERLAHFHPDDYPEPEVALLLVRAGFDVREIQVAMRQRTAGQSSISLLSGLFYVAKVTTALLLDVIRDPWPRQPLERGAPGARADRPPQPSPKAVPSERNGVPG